MSIAQTTRYPVKLLQPTADLEIDLGIDSVKRVEIVVALEKEFGLQLADQPRDKSIRTIADIAAWVDRMGGTSGQPGSTNVASEPQVPTRFASAAPAPLPVPVPPPKFQPSTPQFESRPATPAPPAETPSMPPYMNGTAASNGQSRNAHVPADPSAMSSGTAHRSLTGKIALVTGSGRGVGKVIARVLAAHGATVVVNSFHSRDAGEQTVAEINGSGGQAIHLWGSVAKPEQVDSMFDEIESRFGRLDILVCNASNGKIGSFMELTAEDWDRAFRTNVSGHHHCSVRASKLMQRVGGGSIITMSAVGSHRFIHGLGSQGIVKAAVETQTRYLACELGKYGIRVNCVVGGPVYGELLSKFPDAQATQHHWETVCPDGHLTSPLDIANTIGFLVSDDARGINGAIWAVDHGFSAMSSGQPIPKPMVRSTQQATW